MNHVITIKQIIFYYMEESVLLETKPLVDSIRHFIRDPSGVFSVCHLCECRIVQWPHDSRLLLLLNWFLHIIKRTLHVGSKIWILCSRGKNNISLEQKIHIFSPPCNILYILYKCTTKSSHLNFQGGVRHSCISANSWQITLREKAREREGSRAKRTCPPFITRAARFICILPAVYDYSQPSCLSKSSVVQKDGDLPIALRARRFTNTHEIDRKFLKSLNLSCTMS